MTMKKSLMTILAAALVIGSASAYAWGGKHHDHGMYNLDMMEHVLDLTEAQKQELAAFKQEARQQRKAQFKERGKVMLMDLDPAAADYQAQVQALAEKNAQLAKERTLQHAAFHAKVHAVLTPEQRVKLKEVMEDMRAKHHRREKRS